jgi:hypothetical protein
MVEVADWTIISTSQGRCDAMPPCASLPALSGPHPEASARDVVVAHVPTTWSPWVVRAGAARTSVKQGPP